MVVGGHEGVDVGRVGNAKVGAVVGGEYGATGRADRNECTAEDCDVVEKAGVDGVVGFGCSIRLGRGVDVDSVGGKVADTVENEVAGKGGDAIAAGMGYTVGHSCGGGSVALSTSLTQT